MCEFLWTEPYSTIAFWSYIFLCVAALWYWSYAGLFQDKKRWVLLASSMGGAGYMLAVFFLEKALYPAWIFLCTACCLYAVSRWKKIVFSRQEYLVSALLSLLIDAMLVLLPLTIWLEYVGLK